MLYIFSYNAPNFYSKKIKHLNLNFLPELICNIDVTIQYSIICEMVGVEENLVFFLKLRNDRLNKN